MTVAEQPQHMTALDLANNVSTARAELKHQIKSGEVKVPALLTEDIPDWMVKMRVEQILGAIFKVGPRVYTRWLYEVPCSPLQPIGYLTARQRLVLARLVRDWEAKAPERAALQQRRREKAVA